MVLALSIKTKSITPQKYLLPQMIDDFDMLVNLDEERSLTQLSAKALIAAFY